MYYDASRLKLKDWTHDPKRPKELYKANIIFLREAKDLLFLIGRNKVLLWFFLVRLNLKEFQTLFYSCKKQRLLVYAVMIDLKKFGVTSKYVAMFKRDFASIRRRVDYVYKMVIENLRMTEYYPYFQSVGFDVLKDYAFDHTIENTKEEEARLLADIDKWNSEHQEEIAAYMESIKEEKENMERHRAKIKEDEKREKEEAKRAKAEIIAFEKESARIRKQQRNKYKKLERGFERYYNGKY